MGAQLAPLGLGIDNNLYGCDLVSLPVSDICPGLRLRPAHGRKLDASSLALLQSGNDSS